MTDRNLNKVKKLPTETWAQTLGFANKQIELLLQRCDDLVKARDAAATQAAEARRDGAEWRDAAKRKDAEMIELRESMDHWRDRATRLSGYRDRIQEAEGRTTERVSEDSRPWFTPNGQ